MLCLTAIDGLISIYSRESAALKAIAGKLRTDYGQHPEK